jgi:endonuclease/exonuclease/phosphatase family metal-dependent hydrolase
VAAVGDDGPALLVGDLNAAIDAPELAAFAGWTDGFSEPPGDPARVSTDDGWSIDHVLGRGVEIHGCRVVREAGDLSDHHPVVADVDVPWLRHSS